MHALHDRPYLHGDATATACGTSPTSCRTSPGPRFRDGTVDLVPNNFSEVPRCCARALPKPARAGRPRSPPDRHGYFSLGTNADYVAPFIGQVPFFLEANPQMPRTFGRNQHPPLARWRAGARSTDPLVEVPPAVPDDVDQRIAGLVAERIPDGATSRSASASIPNASSSALPTTATSASTPSCSPTA